MCDISIGTCLAKEACRAIGPKDLWRAQLCPLYNEADIYEGAGAKASSYTCSNNEGISTENLRTFSSK